MCCILSTCSQFRILSTCERISGSDFNRLFMRRNFVEIKGMHHTHKTQRMARALRQSIERPRAQAPPPIQHNFLTEDSLPATRTLRDAGRGLAGAGVLDQTADIQDQRRTACRSKRTCTRVCCADVVRERCAQETAQDPEITPTHYANRGHRRIHSAQNHSWLHSLRVARPAQSTARLPRSWLLQRGND